VDDTSSEDVAAATARYAAAGVRYVRPAENGGLSAASATGQAETAAEAFLNSDDLLLPGALAALEVALEARPDAALAFCHAPRMGRGAPRRRAGPLVVPAA